MAVDIAKLMPMVWFEKTPDDFYIRSGRDFMLLDAVVGGRHRASSSRLLRLPAEILTGVIELLACDQGVLASLALVNSDCRQLARCAQFANVNFDYSIRKQKLFAHLLSDGVGTGIGSCIRRLVIAPHPHHIAEVRKDISNSLYGDSDQDLFTEEEKDRLREEANEHYRQVRHSVLRATATVMPNLKVLICKDAFPIDKDTLLAIVRSPAQYVKLSEVTIDVTSCLELPASVETWPVRTLNLDLKVSDLSSDPDSETDWETDSEMDMEELRSDFYKMVFQLCAPTLESLDWTIKLPQIDTICIGSRPVPLSFPRLGWLLLCLDSIGASTLSALLRAPLRHIELPYLDLEECASALSGCEPLRGLQSFVLGSLPTTEKLCKHVAAFLARHRHIETLLVHEAKERNDKPYLERCILPLLVDNSFANLRSLSLAWGVGKRSVRLANAIEIPDTALAMVGTIVSLEQLYLGARVVDWQRYYWLVDHARLRHHLRRLVKLKIIALDGDTYASTDAGDRHGDQYYETKFLAPKDYLDAEAGPELDADAADELFEELHDALDDHVDDDEIDDLYMQHVTWERAHRNRMLAHVEAYAAVLPALQWMFCGALRIEVEQDPHGPAGPRRAVPLTAKRGTPHRLFNRIFGIGEQ